MSSGNENLSTLSAPLRLRGKKTANMIKDTPDHHEDVETDDERRERLAETEGMGDNSFSAVRDQLIRDFGSCLAKPNHAPAIMEELLDALSDLGVLNLRTRPTEDDDRNAQMFAICQKILTYTWENPSLPDQFAARYVHDQPWLDDIIGHLTPTEFAAKIGVTKQRVTDAVVQAQRYFKRPPRKGQRDDKARDNMRNALMNRLKNG